MAGQPYEAALQLTRRRRIAGIKPARRLTGLPSLPARATVSRHPFPPIPAASSPSFPATSRRYKKNIAVLPLHTVLLTS